MATKRSDGRWQEYYYDVNGKRKVAYGKTKKEAREKAILKEQESKEKSYVSSKMLTLDQYHERWEKARYGTVKESTIRKQSFEYKNAADVTIDRAGTRFGDLKISEIEVQNVRDLQEKLQNQKKVDGSSKYNTNTVNGIMNHVKHVMNDALRERVITWNPFCSVKNLKRTEEEARDGIHRALTKEETKLFFETAMESWYYYIFQFAIYSGCRCGEIGALRISDIDFDKMVLKIRRTITKRADGHYVIGSNTKTSHGMRDIPLTGELNKAIKEQREINSMMFRQKDDDPLIFVSPQGSLLDSTCVNREIARVCKKAGIPRFTAHCFRDTFATRCIESGMNPKTLQEILGHADIGITMNLYCHVMDETKVKEMGMLSIDIGEVSGM